MSSYSMKIMFLISITLINCFPTETNTQDCEYDCVPFEECKHLKYYASFVQSENGIQYCSDKDNIVCCWNNKKKVIAEKKCLEFTKIRDFCSREPLVMNGSQPNPHAFPFMALIQNRLLNQSVYESHCGGTLLNSMFVLTAAHCVDKIQFPDREFSVLLGAHDKNNSGTRFNVTVFAHPNFTTDDPYADLALLKLHNEADITTKFIKPACLSTSTSSTTGEYTVGGWGYHNTRSKSNVLLIGTVVKADSKKCPNDLTFNMDKQICAGPKNDLGDVCNGDSGGPLFTIHNDNDCLFEVFGVLSGGALCTLRYSFSSHTLVSFYREWIESMVWPDEKQNF
ncbi:mast cell protease 2-like [Drosophila novamexicana]|uniref:mast cell protease 2-like n=1 Tax=Drosophila novamexicana TaxID=47314 RepID=UPI0011E5D7D5|nr:mast cell protease 2-like [Drosophila novamexicana]